MNIESTFFVNVPDGMYEGFYSGWEVKIKDIEPEIKFRVNHSVRGVNIPVNIYVEDRKALVEIVQ